MSNDELTELRNSHFPWGQEIDVFTADGFERPQAGSTSVNALL